MAVYEQRTDQVISTVKDQSISDIVKTTVETIIMSAGQTVKVQQFEGQPLKPTEADVVSVPPTIQVSTDPGGKIVLINANAPGVKAEFDATQTARVVVATMNDDIIRFTGSNPVTVETGGGNDSVVTAQGEDLIVVSGRGKVTVESGGGFDLVQVKTEKTNVDVQVSADKVVVVSSGVEVQLKDSEVIIFDDGKIAVVAKDPLEGYVARLYEVLFDREADLGGIKFWLERAQASADKPLYESLKEIISGFISSKEYADKYANTTDEQFLRQLYQGMANREPDPEGFKFWMDQLAKGTSRLDVITSFVTSEEAIKVLGATGNDYVIDLWIKY